MAKDHVISTLLIEKGSALRWIHIDGSVEEFFESRPVLAFES
jgi:hypothetical protein